MSVQRGTWPLSCAVYVSVPKKCSVFDRSIRRIDPSRLNQDIRSGRFFRRSPRWLPRDPRTRKARSQDDKRTEPQLDAAAGDRAATLVQRAPAETAASCQRVRFSPGCACPLDVSAGGEVQQGCGVLPQLGRARSGFMTPSGLVVTAGSHRCDLVFRTPIAAGALTHRVWQGFCDRRRISPVENADERGQTLARLCACRGSAPE